MNYGQELNELRACLSRHTEAAVGAKQVHKRAYHMGEAVDLEIKIRDVERRQLEDMARDIEPSRRNDTRLLLVLR